MTTHSHHRLPPKLNAIELILLEKSSLSVTDHYGNIIYVSESFCEQCGYSEEELIGQTHAILKSGNHSKSYYEFLWSTISAGNEWRGEICNRNKNGESYWVERDIIPILDEDGQPEYYIALSKDITKNKALIRKLQNRAQQQGLIAILGHLSINHQDIDVFVGETVAAVTGALEMQRGMVFDLSPDRTQGILCASAGMETDSTLTINIEDGSLFDFALHQENPVISKNMALDKRFQLPTPLRENFFDHSALVIKIGDRKAPAGLMMLTSDSRRDLTVEDSHFAQTTGNLISEALARHKIQQALLREKELNRKYLDVANFIIVILDSDGLITLANQKASASLGLSQKQLVGHNWFDEFIPGIERLQAKSDFKQLLKDADPKSELPTPGYKSHIINGDGEQRLVYWNNTLIVDEDSNQPLLLCAGEDITELERARKEKSELTRELYQAQKMEALGILAGGIAHDFNNILGSILGFTELALERFASNGNDKLASYLNQIRNSGFKARDIIAQIQNLHSPVHGENEPVLLPSLIGDILKMMRSAIPRSVDFQQQLDTEVPAVNANPAMMNQLVMNLIINARNALGGSGKMHIGITDLQRTSGRCASCGEEFSGHYIELAVSDSGPGINLNRLGEYFEKDINPYMEDGTSGGLKSIDRITHESQGHILVDSSAEKGTVFRILFSVSGGEKSTPVLAPSLTHLKSTPANNADVMIVDDENSVATFVGELFNLYGFRPHVFTDPTEALRAFVEHPEAYQLVVTDQTMPVINGDQLAQKMIALNPDIPIIMCTGFSDTMDEKRAAEMNIRGFLKKPVQPTELLSCAYRLLDMHGS